MTTPVAYVIYNSKRIIPAPQVQFTRNSRRTADGTIIGWEHKASLRGKLVACKGWDFSGSEPAFYTSGNYPTDDANCCKFQNLLDMQEKFLELFERGQDYKWFEIQNPPTASKKWRARVENVEFAEGRWIDYVDYNVTLDLQSTSGTNDYEELYDNLLDYNETWDVSFSEESGGIYQLKHTLSCTSKEYANSDVDVDDGWIKAKQWIQARLAGTTNLTTSKYTTYTTGIKNDIIIQNTGFDLSNYTAYDYNIEKGVDELGGRYNVTESWKLAKDPIYRAWTVECQRNRNGENTVQVNGMFVGLIYNRFGETDLVIESGNYNLVKTLFDSWIGSGGPYSIASGYYDDYIKLDSDKELNSCPITRNITINEESRLSTSGVNTDVTTSKTRTINFAYSFSDLGSNDKNYTEEQTVTVTRDEVEACYNIKIDGNITPILCESGNIVNIGESGWIEVSGNLASVAASGASCDDSFTMRLRRSSISRDKIHGKINYSYEYTCCDCITVSGALEENVSITWNKPADVIAKIPILGRTGGPLIQDKGTVTENKCNIDISLKFAPVCGSYSKPSGIDASVSGILNSAMCCTGTNVYTESDTENWQPRTGRYTRQVTYICEMC